MNEEFTDSELKQIEEHNRDLQDEEISILQAIKDYKLDKISRDRLEYKYAKHLLELDDLVYRLKLLSSYQTKKILEELGFFGGNPTGILKIAMEKGVQQQKSGFARENAKKGVAKRPSSIALKKIEEIDYPLHCHLFHLDGRINEFVNAMLLKYPELKSTGALQRLISKLNKLNGIITKNKPKK